MSLIDRLGVAPTSHRMRPFDLLFFQAETHAEPQHVGALLVFGAPPAAAGWQPADLVAAYRAAALASPFDRLPQLPRLGMPHWTRCSAPDMQYHVQHLRVPAPGGTAQLVEIVQELHGNMLDRAMPLFRVWIIEGLADGGFAIYAKIHHALVDGMSALMRIGGSLSNDPKADIGAPFYGVRTEGKRTRARRDFDLGHTVHAVVEQTRSMGDLSMATVSKLVSLALGAKAANTPFQAPLTPINQPVANGRALGLASLPLAAVQQVANALGGTINDAVLVIVDVALSRYLQQRGAAVDRPLVAMVPVSLRVKGDTQATTKASVILAELGDPGSTTAARLEQVIQRTARAKAEVRSLTEQGAKNHALALYLVAAGLGGLGMKNPSANVTVSNVPGPREALYLGGAPLKALFPVSIVTTRIGLNVTLVSLDDQLHLGFLSDRNQLPDPETLVDLAQEALAELLAPAAKPKRRKRAA